MTSLATIKPTGNPYALALSSAKILEQKKADACQQIVDILSKLHFEAGQGTEEKKLMLTAIALHDEIKTYFPFLRMEELRLALSNGIRGEYGEFRGGINIVSFNAWIRGYQHSEARKEAIAAKSKPAEEIKPTNEQLAEIEREYLLSLKGFFRRFKENGRLDHAMPQKLFDDFEQRGFLKLSDEQCSEIYIRARKDVIKELGATIDRKKRQALKRFQEGHETAVDKELVWQACYRIAIEDYWNELNEEQWSEILNPPATAPQK